MPAAPDFVISHWSHLLEGFQTSTLDFYAAVERAIEKRQVPDTVRSRGLARGRRLSRPSANT